MASSMSTIDTVTPTPTRCTPLRRSVAANTAPMKHARARITENQDRRSSHRTCVWIFTNCGESISVYLMLILDAGIRELMFVPNCWSSRSSTCWTSGPRAMTTLPFSTSTTVPLRPVSIATRPWWADRLASIQSLSNCSDFTRLVVASWISVSAPAAIGAARNAAFSGSASWASDLMSTSSATVLLIRADSAETMAGSVLNGAMVSRYRSVSST